MIGSVSSKELQPFLDEGFTVHLEKEIDEKIFRQASMLLLAPDAIIDAQKIKKAARLKTIGLPGKAKILSQRRFTQSWGSLFLAMAKQPPKLYNG